MPARRPHGTRVRRFEPHRGSYTNGSNHDPWYGVALGATGDRNPDALDQVKKQLHDQVIEQLGDKRTGPVQWQWWPARRGLRMLEDEGYGTDGDGPLRDFLRAHPQGLLVIAMAPTSEEQPA